MDALLAIRATECSRLDFLFGRAIVLSMRVNLPGDKVHGFRPVHPQYIHGDLNVAMSSSKNRSQSANQPWS